MKKTLKILISINCVIAVMSSSFAVGALINKSIHKDIELLKQTSTTNDFYKDTSNIYESYENVLKDNHLCDYTLLNLDSDDIPELITSSQGESGSSIILNIYSFTETDGAFAIGEISDCNEKTILCVSGNDNCFYTNNLYDDYYDKNGTLIKYYQKIEMYYKSKNSLNSEIFVEKSFEKWSQNIEDNYFIKDFKTVNFNNKEANHYYDLLLDVIVDNVECKSDSYDVNIYNTLEFDFKNNNYGNCLNVTREDLYNLGTGFGNSNSFLNKILGDTHCDCPINYQGQNGKVEDLIRKIIGEGAHGETYEYYFGELKSVKYTDKHDPLNRFSEKSMGDSGPTGEYYIIPAKNIRWIMTNIFNVTEWVDSYSVEVANYNCYLLDDMFYAQCIAFDGGDYTKYYIKHIEDNKNGTYHVNCYDAYSQDDNYYMTVALKNINGKRQWTILELER